MLPGRFESHFAAPAHLVEPDGGEWPNEREAGGKRIEKRHYIVAEGEPGKQDTNNRIDQADEDCMRRHCAKIVHASAQGVVEIIGPEAANRRKGGCLIGEPYADRRDHILLRLGVPPELLEFSGPRYRVTERPGIAGHAEPRPA